MELCYFDTENDQLLFKEAYADFKGNKVVLSRKRKVNKKYYVYDATLEEPVEQKNKAVFEIIDEISIGTTRLIFYIDEKQRISFIRTGLNNPMTNDELIRHVEHTPQFMVKLLWLFNHLYIFGVLRFDGDRFNQIKMTFGLEKNKAYELAFLFPHRIRTRFSERTNKFFLLLHVFRVKIPKKDLYAHYLETSDINMPLFLKMEAHDQSFFYNLKERVKHRYTKKHYLYNTRSVKMGEQETEVFVRKSVTGQYVIVVTNALAKMVMVKERLAYLLANLTTNKEKYNIYFEKFCEGASESAFVLFDYAEKKDPNAVYVLDGDHHDFDNLKKKYGHKLVMKNSFLAFYKIFKARSFISSDLVSHIQRRLYDNDRLIKQKILKNRKKIFLQHGVCLATNVFERGYYNRKVPIAPDYIVVSSAYEQELFETYTTYNDRHFIHSGLPNMDLYVDEKQTDKQAITFLLTWRPWDLTGVIEPGSYISRYQQFIDLVTTDPFYHDKEINIILHPKAKQILREQFPKIYAEHKDLLYDGNIKEALLSSKILVSDYSSVVFFAFAGGSQVIFYWEDKEKAEAEYGAPNILQEEIAFGDIVYSFDDIHHRIKENYAAEQKSENIKRYSRLVEHTSGENTRLAYERIYDQILNPSFRYEMADEKLGEESNEELNEELNEEMNQEIDEEINEALNEETNEVSS